MKCSPSLALLLCCLTFFSLTGCHRDVILSTDQMADILFDIYRFDAVCTQEGYMEGKTRARYYNGIFEKHHTDKEQFDNSLTWYAENPEKWRQVFTKLKKKGELYAEQIQNGQLPELQAYGIALSKVDSLNLWLSRENLYWYEDLNDSVESERLHQCLDGRKYFVGADKVDLSYRMRCTSADADSVHSYMTIHYVRDEKVDSFQVNAPADGKWYRYHLSSGTPRKTISRVDVCIVDSITAPSLSSIEYENLRLLYIYHKENKHIDINDERIINRQQNNKRNRQERFNLRRY